MKHRGSGLALAILAGVVSVAGAAAAGAETEVTQIRLGVHPGAVRVVVEASAKLKISSFVLVRPYRVVLDMPEVRWRLPMGTGRRGKGFVAGYRFGQFVPGRARMVFDLKGPAVIVKSFTIPPTPGRPWRFVLDLKRTTAAEARARAGRRTAAVASARRGQPLARSAKKPQTSQKVVVIDPGHGGIDPGTTGAKKRVFEKHITLAMARRLKRELDLSGRYKTVLTRTRDVFVRLRGRIARARASGADLFVSLHADSMPNSRIRGASIYTLSERASDKEAAALAARENKADLIAGMDLSHNSKQVTDILINLAQRETMNHSVRFARFLFDEMRHSTRFLRKSHRFAGFAVLKAPDVPSVLLEMGYLSNAQDEERLTRPRYQARLAKAMARAIDRYFDARGRAAGR
ncbi:MAG: N-acetylmuramoyl-L-alanine amidase [Alphaproteobacteria bacterium]|nr:N-acetylmuramoyl-L-alanine amidase [Alphaproteobacteria bacterium]MCZ6609071.1 N-acetylmuramoyl-L-alanine amidase [Alphaproteobacteria bacterium]MCZ6813425.1 N-acetylmuramoyl-L-alanine amidase [Alphaproteobacteria bacterium]MCZ6849699.1 N-acetylmuramoyl-L-alanine amidase [Alphaproteobacteria bacterium]